MKPGREDLVRVTSEAELRAGMLVYNLSCEVCGSHWTLLLRAVDPALGQWRWSVETSCKARSQTPVTFGYAIGRGAIYRLRDLDDSTEQQRTKQRERVE